ncbi:MAG: acyl-CoA dehydrogenase family protein [Oligoflexia bacterium]|nr:acyl-CoA dehydrogenase family protein [Oligoflexia bacterium]
MDFQLSETQNEIIEMTRKFAKAEIAPIVDQDEANSHFRRELFPKLGAAGLLSIPIPESYGGIGLGSVEYALFLEELGYYSSAYATSVSVTNLPASIILEAGNEEQKKKYLPKILSGEWIGGFCLTEPSSGSDAGSLISTAKKEGDHYIINGVKQFITNGMHADLFIVMARTGGPGSKGVSSFLVETKTTGVKAGKLEKKMGMRASPTQEIIFENVKIPAGNLVGKEGEGFTNAKGALDGGRISIAAISNGISRAALDKALAYAKERSQFGKNIIEYQGISFMLAEMATELEASRLLTLQAAALKDKGEDFRIKASMAKLKSTEACMQITTNAVQVLGGYGYMEEYVVERYMREAKMMQIVEGTSQIQKFIIARGLS